MTKVTRIAYSDDITDSKRERLGEIASRLGDLRSEIWRDFGSIGGLDYRGDRAVRDEWLAEGRSFDVPARLWKATLADVWADIDAYKEAAKVKVRKEIWKRTQSDDERKRLFALLKADRWDEDSYLHRRMRKHFGHGKTSVDNQIILDSGCYTAFMHGGKAWIDVMSLERGDRIAIPFGTNVQPTGTLRLILRDGKVEVHYAVPAKKVCAVGPSGTATIGIDKGYSEAFTDSDGQRHGEGLGDVLSAESDYLKAKYQRRNKLKALAEKHRNSNKTKKRNNILTHNLGRRKLDSRRKKHTANVRDVIFKAAHTVVDKAAIVATEDLTSPIASRKSYGKNQSRRLSGWVKGTMAEAINTVSNRRGASVILVNAAYTSQMDSRYGVLLGTRSGNTFYCFDGAVLDADQNAARNILARISDTEIKRFTPFVQVKQVLTRRTVESRLGLLNQDTSCSETKLDFSLSTVSELPY